LPELKELLKEHDITRISHMNETEITELLKEHGILPQNYLLEKE
jgi:hypothetical protein